MGRRVLTIGTFDLFHVGHIELLRACRDLAGSGRVVVGVNADRFVQDFKGRRPVITAHDRFQVVEACRYVDDVFIHPDRSATQGIIAYHRPDIIAVGDDWLGRDYLGQLGVTQDWLDALGTLVVYIPRTTGESTTQLRARTSD